MGILIFQIISIWLAAIIPLIVICTFTCIIAPERFYNKEHIRIDYLGNIYLCGWFLWVSYYTVRNFQECIIEKLPESVTIPFGILVGGIVVIGIITLSVFYLTIKYGWNKMPGRESLERE